MIEITKFNKIVIYSVFERKHLKVKSLDLQTCCEYARKRKWKMVMALSTDKTGISTGLTPKFLKNPDYYSRNFLVGLGPHTTPLFLFKG